MPSKQAKMRARRKREAAAQKAKARAADKSPAAAALAPTLASAPAPAPAPTPTPAPAVASSSNVTKELVPEEARAPRATPPGLPVAAPDDDAVETASAAGSTSSGWESDPADLPGPGLAPPPGAVDETDAGRLTAGYAAEAAAAVEYIEQLAAGVAGPGPVRAFSRAIASRLEARLAGHWWPGEPCRGSGHRCLRWAEDGRDPAIVGALADAGLDLAHDFRHVEFTLWIDPGEVAVAFGRHARPTPIWGPSPMWGRTDAAAAEPAPVRGRPTRSSSLSATARSFSPARGAGSGSSSGSSDEGSPPPSPPGSPFTRGRAPPPSLTLAGLGLPAGFDGFPSPPLHRPGACRSGLGLVELRLGRSQHHRLEPAWLTI